jgi:hypothetical protein
MRGRCVILLDVPADRVIGEVVISRQRGTRDVRPAPHHPDVGDAGDLTIVVAHQELRLELVQVADEDQNTHHGVVCNARATVIQNLTQAAPCDTADLAKGLERRTDPRRVPVLRGDVGSHELHQILVGDHNAEVGLLMANQTQLVTTQVDR